MSTIALIGAIPMALSVILVAIFGVETCKRRLEEIIADELKDKHNPPQKNRRPKKNENLTV
jgi:uncharacterized membrane protein